MDFDSLRVPDSHTQQQLRFRQVLRRHLPFACFMGSVEGAAFGMWLSIALRRQLFAWELYVGAVGLTLLGAALAAWAVASWASRHDPEAAQRAYLENFRRKLDRA